ncbi:phage shock protein A [Croceifilum oryzae]|uniref:Phage shock protein A n=1 Tax=Croceifilum oryzae TaxID=1553429 RepID=A0AAJ1TLC9_9BACL|nr:DUF3732 domain-containing protein [Croceifilum oryzae]MDQ0416806.1 phage shock protein A [Croceifilum oryzae]
MKFKRKKNELEAVQHISLRWLAELQTRVSEARELGLVRDAVSDDKEVLIDILKELVKSNVSEINISEQTVGEAMEEHEELRQKSKKVLTDIMKLRDRKNKILNIKHISNQYKNGLIVQRDRLNLSTWLSKKFNDKNDCPVCGSDYGKANQQLSTLTHALENIQNEETTLPHPSLDRELDEVEKKLVQAIERQQALKIRIRSLEERSEEVKKLQYDALKASRFIGKIDESLRMYENLGVDRALQNEIDDLKRLIIELELVVDEEGIRRKEKRMIAQLSEYTSRLLPKLDVEHPEEKVELSIEELSIRVKETSGNKYYLWEIGSGSDWLSYHVAVTLALHQLFIDRVDNPVPSFIVYDQPSQVYFPQRLVDRSYGKEEEDPTFSDEDIDAVKKIFNTVSHAVEITNGNLQVIILDHASEEIWIDLKHVYKVNDEEWRNGKKLIPDDWII